MANRRMLVKSNQLHQNVVVSASATSSAAAAVKARCVNNHANKNFSTIINNDKTTITLFISLTIVSCLLINNCLSFAYNLNEIEQQWPDSTSVYWDPAKNNINVNENDVVPGSLRRFAPDQSQFKPNRIIIHDDSPSSTYYINYGPQQYQPQGQPQPQQQEPYEHYVIGHQHSFDSNNEDDSQQSSGSSSSYNTIKDNYYYPLINSASESSNDNNNIGGGQDDEATIVEFNSNLLNLLKYPNQLSHSRSPSRSRSSSSSSFDNNINYINFDYDNNNLKQSQQQNDNLLDELNQQNDLIDEGNNGIITNADKVRDLYKIVARKKDNNNNNKPRKFVTLLEDEVGGQNGSEGTNRQKHSAPLEGITTTSGPLDESPTTKASYGTVVTGRTSELDSKATTQPPSSVFNRMYKKLSNYLPFLSQINILKGGKEEGNNNNKTITTTNVKDDDKRKTVADEKKIFSSSNKKTDEENNRDDTKQSVSESIEISNKNNNDNIQQQQDTGSEKQLMVEKDKIKGGYNLISEADDGVANDQELASKQSTLSLASSSPASSSSALYSLKTSGANENDINKDNVNKKRLSMRELDDSDNKSPSNGDNNDGAKVSFLRQSSSVVMPLKDANDELVSKQQQQTDSLSADTNEEQASEESESLIGKYMYSPSGSTKSTTVKKLNNEQQLYRSKVLSHKAFASRRKPLASLQDIDEEATASVDVEDGDDTIISYGPTTHYTTLHRPTGFYTHHRVIDSPLGIMQQNKSNDIYFLIMIGSFCAMAVAVVLTAGLFAYRIQQNRKSTTETDYPTYGVVGPNNMMAGMNGTGGGKCGGIVGSYFNSNLNSSSAAGIGGLTSSIGNVGGILSNSSPMGSKLGSAKHLPDLYSLSDSGITTTGSNKSLSTRRISSSDNNNSTKDQTHNNNRTTNYMANQDAARMYHYQHQKQQMIISDRASAGRHTSASDLDSEDENDDGSYTVYECPGLASAHEMEIKNPLFNDDQTP